MKTRPGINPDTDRVHKYKMKNKRLTKVTVCGLYHPNRRPLPASKVGDHDSVCVACELGKQV